MKVRSGAADAARGLGALATQAATLTLGQPAPDAELFTVRERVLEALTTNDATTTHFFGFARACTTLGEEEIGVDTETVGLVLPPSVGTQTQA